ncbi:MAG: putative portal protein [Prokaryotic dsDNA virus sp.]|nr:MAG: putative portal protein [Prokaryotic dsDNA virus sp.]|tara:strand:- start:5134 stop:6972 length:1839 start_codon:yes stop_codon:yes gene_type:complete
MELLKLKEYQERSYAERPSNQGWVTYGDDNLFPQYLIDLYKSSATHNALCTSIAYMIFGDGVQADTLEARLKMEEWGLQDEVRKACLDLKIQGGFALEVVYSIDRKTISKVRHCPFENVRSAEVNDDEQVEFYYYSKDWSDKREDPQIVSAFNPETSVEFPVQILYVKPFSPGSYYYPKPDYIGSIDYIELDKEIGKYHINNIKNGLAPSFTIHFKNGVPAQEERRRIRNDIERQLAGATNAGKFIVTYSDSPDRKPDFEPFPLSDADKQYQFLSEEVVAKIMVGHRVTSPMMFGVMVPGKLGGGLELKTAEEIFAQEVIDPYQMIVTEALVSIFNAAGTPASVTLYKPEAEEANVDISYTGVQISSAVDIIAKVGTGELTRPQAVQLLVAMLGFDRDTANRMFDTSAEATELSEDIPTAKGEVADFLIEMGEEMDDDWELIDARRVDYDEEEKMNAMWNFAKVPSGKPQAKSEQDNELIKVRYAYMPKVTGKNGNPSREFCQRMVNAGDRVWRKEDIDAASQRAVNPGWGPNGADTYDLWLYKGGGSCQHFWERRTYLRKNNNKISANRARKILREAGLDPLPKNDPRVAKRPRDMQNRGFLKPKNWTTPK